MNNLKRTWTTEYTVVSNVLVNCFSIHPMTRFLCIYLAAQSDTFQFNNSVLCNALSCTEATLRKYMKEAIKHGLIVRTRKTINGKFGYFDYTLIDPTTLQNLPAGKKTKVEKNQGGKNVRLNKEELSNKEEKSNKGRLVGSAGELQTLINQPAPTPEQIDTAFATSVSEEKEKNSAQKEKSDPAVVIAIQAKPSGQLPPTTGEIKATPAPPTIEETTAAIMAEIGTEAGQRKLKFAAGRGGVKKMPENILAAVARYVEHRAEQGRPVASDPIYKLGGYLKTQARNEANSKTTQSNYANRTNNTRPVKSAQPVISRAQSVSLAEEILAERAAERAGN